MVFLWLPCGAGFSLWTVPYGHYAFTDGELIAESGEQ